MCIFVYFRCLVFIKTSKKQLGQKCIHMNSGWSKLKGFAYKSIENSSMKTEKSAKAQISNDLNLCVG